MNEKELKKMPPLTRSAVSGLTDGQRRMFNSEYGQKRYRTPEAYALWLVFGLHYAYLSRWGMHLLETHITSSLDIIRVICILYMSVVATWLQIHTLFSLFLLVTLCHS